MRWHAGPSAPSEPRARPNLDAETQAPLGASYTPRSWHVPGHPSVQKIDTLHTVRKRVRTIFMTMCMYNLRQGDCKHFVVSAIRHCGSASQQPPEIDAAIMHIVRTSAVTKEVDPRHVVGRVTRVQHRSQDVARPCGAGGFWSICKGATGAISRSLGPALGRDGL